MKADCLLLFNKGKAEALVGRGDEFLCSTTKVWIAVEKYQFPNHKPSVEQIEDIQHQIKGIDKLVKKLLKAKKELENGTPTSHPPAL